MLSKNKKNVVFYILAAFIILLLLASPNIVYLYFQNAYSAIFISLSVIAAVFIIPIVFFYKNIKVYFYLIAIIALFAPLALMPPILFNLELNTDILTLVVNTNYHEAKELIQPYIFSFSIFFISFLLIYFFCVTKLPSKISFKTAILLSGSGILLLAGIALLKSGSSNYISQAKGMIFQNYPFNVAYSAVKFSDKIKRIDHDELVGNFTFHARKKDTFHQQQVYILVIGETGRFDHWEINGYERNTSPRLSKRKKLLSYKNVASAGAMTEQSVPLIITRATANDYDRHYKEKSILEAFKEAGFKTFWISNQTDYFNIAMHTKDADSLIMIQKGISTKNIKKDAELIGYLKDVLQNDTSNLFIVLHTMGSHFNYNQRYPENFNVFKPSGDGGPINPTEKSNKSTLINAYDNSILYTDMVLDSIISVVKDQHAISYMMYLADHGENLFDDERQLSLHAPGEPTKYVTHIPFFIWTSDKYDSTYHSKSTALKTHLSSKISSDNVFESLLDMSNISYPQRDSTKSIAGPYFKDSPQLVLGGNLTTYNYKELK